MNRDDLRAKAQKRRDKKLRKIANHNQFGELRKKAFKAKKRQDGNFK